MNEKIKNKINDLYSKIYKLSLSSSQLVLLIKPEEIQAQELIYLSPERTSFYEISTKSEADGFFNKLATAFENNEWLFVYLKKPDVISTQLITNLNTLDTMFYAQSFSEDKTIKKPSGAAVFFIVDEQTYRDKALVQSFRDCFAPTVWLKESENVR